MNNYREVIRKAFLPLYRKLMYKDYRDDTVEILCATLKFNPAEEYLDYGKTKLASREYIKNELDWYLSKDSCIKGHKGIETNPVWQRCATEQGYVNSNYGKLVFGETTYDEPSQFEYALSELISNKYTRQAIMIYNRPEMHQWKVDGIHANHDFTCTMYTHFFIDNQNKLHMIVNMRSNDAIFGLQNDYSWQRYVYFKMFNELKEFYITLNTGSMIWQANSLHVYHRHFELLEKIAREYRNESI